MVKRPDKLDIFSDIIKPYFSAWLPYILALGITWPIRKALRLKKTALKIQQPNTFSEPLLCLEAGEKGWEIIEYKELYQSALEYLGDTRVIRFVVSSDEPYLVQLERFLDQNKVTHYGWSPRTGEQHWLKGLVEALKISIILSRRGIIPIAFLTDMLVRRWRAKASMVTASSGVVVTLMSHTDVSIMCPHRRFVGPYIMPFSAETVRHLAQMRSVVNQQNSAKDAVVLGALYEPRKSIVESIQAKLQGNGYDLVINFRSLGEARGSDDEYWAKMINSKIVLTTSNVIDGGKGYDWPWKEHFVYRYMEVLASGSLLVAPKLPGIELYFTPGEHFIDFSNEQEAADRIQYYLENDAEAKRISAQGFERAKNLVESRSFWLTLDVFLSKDGLMQ